MFRAPGTASRAQMWSVLNHYPSSVTLSRSIFLSRSILNSGLTGGNAIQLYYCGYLSSSYLAPCASSQLIVK